MKQTKIIWVIICLFPSFVCALGCPDVVHTSLGDFVLEGNMKIFPDCKGVDWFNVKYLLQISSPRSSFATFSMTEIEITCDSFETNFDVRVVVFADSVRKEVGLKILDKRRGCKQVQDVIEYVSDICETHASHGRL